jgi:hypothetical protein
MKAQQIGAALTQLFDIRQPVFLWGPPGVGKSQVVAQTAEKLGLSLIDIRAILLDPVDLRGLPKISEDGRAEWCIPSFLPTEGEGILFLDELNAAPPLVQASCYQLVLDRRLGEYELPDGWSIIAAGNRETDRAVTHRMPSALANRFVHIDFTVDLEEWLQWANGAEIAPEIISFLRFRPALLHDFEPERSSKAFPSPRSWEFASKILKTSKDKKYKKGGKGKEGEEVLKELLTGTVGAGAAGELEGFIAIWQDLPEAADILNNPEEVPIPEDPAVLYAVCEMVGRSASEENGARLFTFASRLPTEFSVLLVREAVRHCRPLAGLDAFADWAANNASVLV